MTDAAVLEAPAAPERPGPSRRGPAVAAGVVLLIGCAAVAGVAATHRTVQPAKVAPTAALVDRPVAGKVDAPPLQDQGQPIDIQLAHGSVVATITGPQVPGQGLPYEQNSTTATFTVTFTHATTDVPLSAADFRVLDQTGRFDGLKITSGTTPPPAVLHAGQQVTFSLRGLLPTGQGIISYASDGTHVEGKWDFIVEND